MDGEGTLSYVSSTWYVLLIAELMIFSNEKRFRCISILVVSVYPPPLENNPTENKPSKNPPS